MLSSAANAMIATMAILMVLSGLSVVLRLFLRRKIKADMKADDYFVITAWAFSVALAITNIVGVPVGGLGVQLASLSEAKAIVFLKVLFIQQFWYIFAVAFVKLSILCFYGRVFGAGRFPISVKILLAVSVAWLISFFFTTLFQAWPISCNWLPCKATMNYPLMYVLSSTTDIVIDISILCLPAFFIRKLQLSGNQKIGVGAIFGLGIFCVVSSIARLAYTILFDLADTNVGNYAVNFSSDAVNIVMWSGLEACASTICANLPCYGPLIGQARSIESIVASLRSFLSIGSSRHSSRGTHSKRQSAHGASASTENIVWLEPGVDRVETHVEGSHARNASRETDVELGTIKVHSSVDVDSN